MGLIAPILPHPPSHPAVGKSVSAVGFQEEHRMEITTASDLPRDRVIPMPGTDSRMARIAVVLIVLGAMRVVPPMIEWIARARSILGYALPPLRGWPMVFRDTNVLGATWGVWPLAVGLLLLGTRWPRLLMASALCSLALAVEGLANLAYKLTLGVGLPPVSWAPERWAHLVPIVGNVAQVGVSLAFVGWVWRMRKEVRRQEPERFGSPSSPTAIAGRLAVVGSIVFALFVGYAELWTMFEEVILRVPSIRLLVAGPNQRHAPVVRLETPEQKRFRLASEHIDTGLALASRGYYREAKRSYIRGINAFEQLVEDDPLGRKFARSRSLALNNLAWLLATCEDDSVRNPAQAVDLARRALELIPEDGNTWNTLGVAQFRNGRLDEALATFDHAMKLRNGGDGYDWFFLAMIHEAKGDSESARHWYDRAVQWREDVMPFDQEVYRFNAEAAQALHLTTPARPRAGTPSGPRAMPLRRGRGMRDG